MTDRARDIPFCVVFDPTVISKCMLVSWVDSAGGKLASVLVGNFIQTHERPASACMADCQLTNLTHDLRTAYTPTAVLERRRSITKFRTSLGFNDKRQFRIEPSLGGVVKLTATNYISIQSDVSMNSADDCNVTDLF